jgi:hypothetical protein
VKPPIALTVGATTLAACFTVALEVRLRPSSAGAFLVLAAWLTAPHVMTIAALLWSWRTGRSSWSWCVLALVVSAGGILFLLDVVFWNRDAQGAIAVVMTPVLQVLAAVVLAPLAWWASRPARAQRA